MLTFNGKHTWKQGIQEGNYRGHHGNHHELCQATYRNGDTEMFILYEKLKGSDGTLWNIGGPL